MRPVLIKLAWAWEILVGILLITPGGVFCIACGQILQTPGYIGRPATLAIGVVSILFGVYGFAKSGAASKAAGTAVGR